MEINQLQGAHVYANATGSNTAVENIADKNQNPRPPGSTPDTRPDERIQEAYAVEITREARELSAQETARAQQALVPADEKSNSLPPADAAQADRPVPGPQPVRQALDIIA